ncbi:uncharacterized protein MELLADRAFT_118503 [Melampsora larici-populina 98AG31]|uniref:Secreted protein n=1 Tax=Melampsora larici-populina (strain 98AG31 / pathotype 3-4-7) TaxID=747676 RepID=F4S9U7_MELLP|nr:uncharacterized protein MELLADRAFT_118503 [Melampsora larici-populina 98AG31]EGF98598.1 hypothetical protein MELLADRAFT_118503 [Melampsora larici-populina 98AG31]
MVSSRISNFTLLAVAIFFTAVSASSHKITLVNNCGTATKMQLPGRGNFGAGTYTFDGDIRGGIAQACGDLNGIGCHSIEFTLVDGVTSADMTLIPPHKFDHPAKFTLRASSGTQSASCQNSNCGPKNAFYKFDDYSAQRQVTGPGSSISMQFC